ncbi:MAG: hypothetical protein IBX56_04995 [Methylomicrobium sp.]|nr:hypothetical protein [Methylomicrobium sp.]
MILSLLKFIVVLQFTLWLPSLHAEPPSPNEIVGTLTVHSDIEGQSSSPLFRNIRGHSWLSFESVDGKTWTVGTWDEGISVGNRKSKKGVNFNLELEKLRHPGAYRRSVLTRDQFAKLATAIDRNNDWTSIRNCSFFASTVWNEVTGEHLKNWSPVQNSELRELVVGSDFGVSRTIPLPSPSGLFDWIFISNEHKFNNDNNVYRAVYEKANPSITRTLREEAMQR